MDHPFLTRREELGHVKARMQTLRDISVLSSRMNAEDHSKLMARRDAEVGDTEVREVLQRRSSRLGMLFEDAGLHENKLAWSTFLMQGTALDGSVRASIEKVERELRCQVEELEKIEQEEASSSESDYSDSRTVSSDEDAEEKEEEEGKEEEGTEEDDEEETEEDDEEEGTEEDDEEETEEDDEGTPSEKKTPPE